MTTIDPTARVADGAVIGDGCAIGPYCVVGPDVTLGPGTTLLAHVHVAGRTTIGAECTIHPFASLGGAPQSLGYKGEPTRLEIGDRCIIRENVTMNVGTPAGGGVTRIGSRGFFMAGSHIGHDCIVGDDVIFANAATLGGHCEIGDHVFIGGLTAVQQFTRVGAQVMLGGLSGVRDDVIPFALANGQRARLEGVNVVGMKRRKFTKAQIAAVRGFVRALFEGDDGVFEARLDRLRPRGNDEPAIAEIIAFIDAGKASGRRRVSLCKPAAGAASGQA